MNSADRFLGRWILITSCGWFIAQAVGNFVIKTLFPNTEFAALPTSPLYFAVFGAVFALSQWICLRERIPNSFGWVLATSIGLFVAALIIKLLNRSATINAFLREIPFFVYLFGGMILGLAQYQAIKNLLQKASWWIIIVSISWTLSQEIIRIHNPSVQQLGVVFFATATGVGLTWLTQQSLSKTQTA